VRRKRTASADVSNDYDSVLTELTKEAACYSLVESASRRVGPKDLALGARRDHGRFVHTRDEVEGVNVSSVAEVDGQIGT
jgi:hypothetical protein